MKTIFMKTIFSTLFFVFFYAATLQAQAGFVINANGDTLRGRFDFSRPGAATASCLRVSFTDDKSGQSKPYVPFQIKGWKLDRDIFFNEAKVLRKANEENGYGVFMQKLSPAGEIACYKYVDIAGEMPRTVYYIEKETKLYEVNMGGGFRKQMTAFFQQAEQLSKDIAEKKYKGKKEKALLAMVAAYNQWFEDRWK
jgi:hypothetical protein